MSVSDQRDALVGRVALMLAATCLVLVAATVLAFALPAVWERFTREGSPIAYAEGDFIDLEPATFRGAASTIFFFSRFSCGACQASKPVMAGIVADLGTRTGVRIVLVTGDALPDEERLFALELGIDPSHIHRTDLPRLRLRLVPTLVLADSTGKILMVREGLLTESDRLDIVRLSSDSSARLP